MMAASVIGEAFRALRANRLRTALSMLGMIIGVGAVVLMLGIGQGARSSVTRAVSSMGSNVLIVMSGNMTAGGVRLGSGAAPTLTIADSEAIARLPSVKLAAPTSNNSTQVAYGNTNWFTSVVGASIDFFEIRAWSSERGDFFAPADVRNAAQVAVLGETVAENLFGSEDPVGKNIAIKGKPFTVVGTLARKGQSLDGRDQDDTIVIPLSTAQGKVFGNPFPGTVRMVVAQARSAEEVASAEEEITQLLRERHRLGAEVENDFTVRNLTSYAQTAAMAARAMTLMLGAIGSIALLVGGIGIMNIMLVSVTERTREIGLRMALGARQAQVMLQFLVEAVVICVIGGFLGVLLGGSVAWFVARSFAMEVELTLNVALVAFAFAAGSGLVFGLFPALRAAQLNPVDALRYE